MQDGAKVLAMPCKHYFHAACLDQWLRQQQSLKHDLQCPMCKSSLLTAPPGLRSVYRAPATAATDATAASGRGRAVMLTMVAPAAAATSTLASASVSAAPPGTSGLERLQAVLDQLQASLAVLPNTPSTSSMRPPAPAVASISDGKK